MKRYSKRLMWGLGFVLLAFLIQYPIQQAESTWETWSLPLSGQTIVIDPGHGGPDGGSVGGDDDALEKDIALDVAKKTRDFLQQSGALVYLTREEDTDLAAEDTKGLSRRKAEDIRKRMTFINDQDADLFITLHLNALSSEKWHGAQTFYHPDKEANKHLAESIQAEIKRNLENTSRQTLPLNNIYLLKHANVPGALVEIGFLSNDKERERLKNETYQEQMSASIYEGILTYTTEDPGD
ncbi:N-acetylmuramoyl-L-alanine amidase CwlD [Barrientosiimonas marina]|uniref:N-acetylmuramoyl-L-alanine amidase CwlD n=1 Tax=Lentibacillus kimchii TaxID=1542911 RepID=A0ABW2US15_9BACI